VLQGDGFPVVQLEALEQAMDDLLGAGFRAGAARNLWSRRQVPFERQMQPRLFLFQGHDGAAGAGQVRLAQVAQGGALTVQDNVLQEPDGPGESDSAQHSGAGPTGGSRRRAGGALRCQGPRRGVCQRLHVGDADQLAADPKGKPVIADAAAASEALAASVCAQGAGELFWPAGSAIRQQA